MAVLPVVRRGEDDENMTGPGRPQGPRKRDVEDGAGNATRVHIIAVNKAVKAAGRRLGETEAPLVETLRTLARQMDESGGHPSTRLSTAYLSALRDLGRALAVGRRPAPGENPIDELRAKREGRPAG